ncbi:MAG TPA: class I SAM-dependent methyltransferase [Ktedonobacteraceae bacterium]|nr:class I SAM-dependent methyltransferase [Ktedonobacteraceae bacterium]
MADPKQIVAQSFDQIGERYAEWSRHTRVEERERYTSLVIDRLQQGATVLDIGCGTGMPTTATLANNFIVTGVDISAQQVKLARQNVPQATFLQADVANLDLAPASFDAVIAFYSLICLPRAELFPVFQKIASWLKPQGLFVAALGAQEMEEFIAPDWLGVPMYWSLFDSATNQLLLQDAGFHILSAQEETEEENGVPITFLWVIAQKPA